MLAAFLILPPLRLRRGATSPSIIKTTFPDSLGLSRTRSERTVTHLLPRWAPRLLVVLALAALVPTVLNAIVPVSSPPPALTAVDINVGAGDQFDPHVSGDWMSYTSDVGIRYYNFVTGTDAAIPTGASVNDLLAGISGSKIVFSRVIIGSGTAIMVFDAATPLVDPVEIDPVTNPTRFGTAIGGNTVAYIDFGLQANGELVIHDLVSGLSERITNDMVGDGNAAVSPDGNVVVWEHCATSLTNCDIWQAVKTATGWVVTAAADTLDPEGNPSSNGTLVAYDVRNGTGAHIFWRPVAGGAAVPLEIAGFHVNPSIAGHVIAFESRPTLLDAADLFVYDLLTNRLFQITDTPLVNEQLNDITVLADGSVRVVWTSDEVAPDQRNVKAATFQLPAPVFSLQLHLPATVVVNATSPSGAIANYVATATDAVDPNPTVTCTPPSGSSFAIRTTVVSCLATNVFGDHATGSFNVVVKGAADQILQLIALEQSFHLRPLVSLSLEAELWIAEAFASSSRPGDQLRACPWLNLFIREVQANIGRTITPAQAAQLIAFANQIGAVLGCR